jgi:hypothetical protein
MDVNIYDFCKNQCGRKCVAINNYEFSKNNITIIHFYKIQNFKLRPNIL